MRRGKKRSRKVYYIAVVILLVAVAGVRLRQSGEAEPIIRTADVEVGTVTSTVSANGILQPLTTVEVKSNVAGQIVKLAVDEGDVVKAGQLIAKIDPTDTVTAYEQNQADLAAARSKVDQARQQMSMQHQQNTAQIAAAKQALAAARTRLLQAQEQAALQPKLTDAAIKQAQSNHAAAQAAFDQMKNATVPQALVSAQAAFDQAQASYKAAERDYNRQTELLTKGFVSKSAVDASEERFGVAKAQLDTARKKLDTVKQETDQDLRSAEARLNQAKAELDNAQANQVQNKVKAQEAAAAEAAVKQAEASLQVALAATYVDQIREGDIVQADAQVKRSEAALKNSKTQLDYTTVVAPRDGVVIKKYVEEGSIVTAGRSSFSGTGSGVGIVDIADVSRMFALVNVDETDIGQIEVGQDVDMTVEAYPDELFSGKVTKIAPQSVVDQSVTTIPVTVEIDIPDQRLKPGMNATCDFVTGRAENVLMVPNEAVKDEDNGSTVTLLKDGKQMPRKIEVGLVGQDYTEVKRGLKKGEKVVTAVVDLRPTGASGGGRPPGARGFGRFH